LCSIFFAFTFIVLHIESQSQSIIIEAKKVYTADATKIDIAENETWHPGAQLNYTSFSSVKVKKQTPYVLRIIIENKITDPDPWYFDLAEINHCTLHKKVNGQWVEQMAGTLVSFRKRNIPIDHLHASMARYQLTYTRPCTDTLYFSMAPNPSPPKFYFNLIPQDISATNHVEAAIFLSMMAIMLIYHFILFLQTKWRPYALYALYILGAIIFIFVSTQESRYLMPWFPLFEHKPYLLQVLVFWHGTIYYVFQVVFTLAFLEMKTRFPRWRMLLVGSAVLMTFLSCCQTFLFFYNQNFHWIDALLLNSSVAAAINMFVLAGYLLLTHFHFARFYVFGVLIQYLLITIAMSMLLTADRAISLQYYHPLFFGGILIEILAFASGLGYRQRQTELQKIQAQDRLIAQLKENQLLQTKVTRELEDKVEERTKQIKDQKEEIISQNEELTVQRDLLDEQNKLLQESRDLIAKSNVRLELAVAERTRELLLQSEKLRAQNQQLEQFSFITAHNLRGPVSRILGLVNIFDQKQSASNLNKEILDKLVVSARDLDTIIHDLGAVLEAQKRNDLQFETVSLRILLNEICKRFDDEIKAASAQINIVASVNEIVTVRAYFDSIITNIVSNSLKYRNPQVPLTIDISVQTEQNNQVTITITDNGLGLDTELHKAKLFQPFQRFNTHTQGKGLGLFLIKTQVKALGGKIMLHGKQGKGLTSLITLPLHQLGN